MLCYTLSERFCYSLDLRIASIIFIMRLFVAEIFRCLTVCTDDFFSLWSSVPPFYSEKSTSWRSVKSEFLQTLQWFRQFLLYLDISGAKVLLAAFYTYLKVLPVQTCSLWYIFEANKIVCNLALNIGSNCLGAET